MSKITLRITILLLVFWVTGGQWLMLQSVAWVNMIRDFKKTDSLSQSLCKTFDGHHACPLCRFIQKQKEAEANQTNKALPKVQKAEMYFVAFAELPVTLLSMAPAEFVQMIFDSWSSSPLSPPPKTV
jgi:hypothetical protein